MLKNKNITLYVTGSVASYKALFLTRLLVKAHANVQVVMTNAAQKFVTPLSFQVISKSQVFTDTFNLADPTKIDHVNIAQKTDLAVMVPASANSIGKIANGLADDCTSLTWLTTEAPKLIVPAMNDQMWHAKTVQRNLHTLKIDGVHILSPKTGFLAEGYQGIGRLPEPEDIVAMIDSLLPQDQVLKGKKVLVTAGGTSEALDPVRSITNASSGKMGLAIAQAFQQHGAQVTLITTKPNLASVHDIELIPVTTAQQMQTAVLQHFPHNNVLIMAAAVADFGPQVTATNKIKKNPQSDSWSLTLTKTPDILQAVAKIKQKSQITIGFAAETQNLIANATQKLTAKKLDLIVANDVSQSQIGFNTDDNQVTFIRPQQKNWQTPVTSKQNIAQLIVRQVLDLLQ
ncbi:bifunctional phosphopantothenoylcysteine decarboxylase/phosphopantothenate--cysteine ligase CoaBC [Bombilactobacillus thymidiniphilus]|uniref:Coenzyme A biosynthesis bifunctional protein CoaBC n=1 Tax=Bombilactobacillus thymidiniphilus TaxID=2923363 RepID=A0ABY4PEC3_9LACO|nr:bifunctional phosphopantothenoylcysteine decarboxylase/phosphopantothenate--cysteine ligase CoaBC [Bombilactobacillus thymidiniphilus]UQS84029.1 bifunctional phosphopantothenoylcysteine decarboxylase/phosphopantothenate--cysteine ligase CoaBC [Bombilactobacillus thymidiniphilus]